MITFTVLTFLIARVRKFLRARAAGPMLLLVAAAAAFPGIRPARADLEDAYAISAEEADAQAAQTAFESEFELEDPAAADDLPTFDADDPDWRKLLRPSIRVRVSKKGQKKRYATVTPDVEYGVVLTGPSAYREGADKSIAPASTSKLFTAALALKHLGADFAFRNALAWREAALSNEAAYVELTGSGDPAFGSAAFGGMVDALVASLAAAKVKRLYGPIEYRSTDARWSLTVKPAGWESKDPSPLDAFGVLSAKAARKVLAAKLRAKGIAWSEAASAPFLPVLATARGAEHVSPPVKRLIRPFMLKSINSFGEALLRKVGEEKGSRAAANLHQAGLALLREYAAANVGRSRVVLNDGSGLSRTSRVTADAMIRFLENVREEPFFDDFFAALPVAGESGTLQGRMRRTAAKGKVHAKTGTIDGNYQLAGYLVAREKGETLYHPFAILTDTATGNAGYCRGTQDKILARLAGLK